MYYTANMCQYCHEEIIETDRNRTKIFVQIILFFIILGLATYALLSNSIFSVNAQTKSGNINMIAEKMTTEEKIYFYETKLDYQINKTLYWLTQYQKCQQR